MPGREGPEICKRFNDQHIGSDVTGVGRGVFDLVRDLYPPATPIHYSLETKNMLGAKGSGHDSGSAH